MRRSFENCKKTVLVDCFDTLLLRQEHPYQVLKRWCICVHRLYPEIEAEDLFQKRMDLMQEIRINENGVYQMYRILAQNYKNGQTEEELFIRDLAMLEIQCDISTVKPNHRLIKKLKKIKKNTSLYCVSDYHYTAGDLRKVLEAHGIDFLDGVYSSADHKMTKQKGTLYPFILQELNLSAGDCMMIGDNRISDIRNAEKAGIRTVYQPQIVRQNYLRVMNRLGKKSFRHDSVSSFGRYLWRSSADYREYALVFYAFCARLYEAVWEAGKCGGGGEKRILFLAREGWFLKKCFDLYQEMRIPAAKRIKTEYLKCSRRAIHSVQEELCKTDFFALDITVRNYFKSIGFSEEEIERLPIGEDIELDVLVKDFSTSAEAEKINDNPELTAIRKKRLNENQNAFKAYFEEKTAGKEVVIVDVGWSGRMQQGITRLFPDVKIYGFYLGIMNQLSSEPKVQRQGLIFNRDEDGRKSRYFDVLRINTQLYEQLLAAPHGSACFYRSEAGGKTVVVEEWEENEKAVYEKYFFDLQNVMEKIFRMCCTYSFDPLLKQESRKLARIILRAGLLQSKKRLKFIKEITGGFSQNFQQQSSGLKYNVGDAKIKLGELLLHPDRYARYACKVSQVLDGKGGGSIGRMLMCFFYFYTRLVCRI